MKELAKKLAEIQKKLVAPKSQVNSFGGYNYRNCEDIMTALKPFLGDVFVIVSDDIVMIGDRFYVKATAKISDGENEISNTAFARETISRKGMDDSQLTGSTSSYARKYALAGLFLIDDNKDADYSAQPKSQFELDETAQAWIDGIKNKSYKPEQIEDESYRKFIMEHVLK